MVEVIDTASVTFEEVAEEYYGKRVSFDDDEGWIAQGWGEQVVLDLIVELLADEGTGANPRWEEVIRYVFKVRNKYNAEGYASEKIETLLNSAWVEARPGYRKLVAYERKTR